MDKLIHIPNRSIWYSTTDHIARPIPCDGACRAVVVGGASTRVPCHVAHSSRSCGHWCQDHEQVISCNKCCSHHLWLFISYHFIIAWPWRFNSLASRISWCDFKNMIFNLALLIAILKSSYDNVLKMNATGPYWWYVNIGSCNGLVLSGNKPLPGTMLT